MRAASWLMLRGAGTACTTLAAVLPVGSRGRLELDVEQRDRYDRVLAYVWLDSLLVNWWLVRDGWGGCP